MDQSMDMLKVKGRTVKYGPHTSVTQTVLGSLPSVALSAVWVFLKNITKIIAQSFCNDNRLLTGKGNGNFNCRGGKSLIVVDQ
jgi:hypothetical protein